MNNNLAYWIFGTFLLACFVGLSMKVGIVMACVVTFILAVLIPRQIYIFILGLITFSVNLTMFEFAFKYWPITLIICLLALWGYLSEKGTKDNDPITNVNDISKLENQSGDIQ